MACARSCAQPLYSCPLAAEPGTTRRCSWCVSLLRKRVPWRGLGTPRMLAGVALLGFLGVVAHSALRPLPIERRAARLRSALAAVAWCVPCVLWFVPEARANAAEFLSAGFGWRSLSCFAYGSVLGAPSFALLWVFDRGLRVPFSASGRIGRRDGGRRRQPDPDVALPLHQSGPILLAGHLSIGLASVHRRFERGMVGASR